VVDELRHDVLLLREIIPPDVHQTISDVVTHDFIPQFAVFALTWKETV
jgi:hypothetical protein